MFYNAAKVQGLKAQPLKKAAAKAVVKPQITTAKTLAAGITSNSPLSQEVITNYISIIPQETITSLIKNYNDAIVEVTDPKTKKLIVLKDLAGLEYLGGAPRGGTFVLLHSGGTVIGDGCLSYYYRIDQGRIFDL